MTTAADWRGMSAEELSIFVTVWSRAFPPKDWRRMAAQVAEAFMHEQLTLAEMRDLLAEWASRDDVDSGLDQETWAHRRHPGHTHEAYERFLAKAALGLGGTIRAMASELVPKSPEVARHGEHHINP